MRVMHKAAVVGAVLVALAGTGAGTALADPPSTPPVTGIVGVGADTSGPLLDQLGLDYNATKPAHGLYSWDAINPKTGATGGLITAKWTGPGDTSCQIGRPDGSSDGIDVLNFGQKDINGDYYCADFAGDARAPKAVSGPNGPDAFAVLAGDAFTWASPAPKSGQTSPVPSNLTVTDMTNIYSCIWTNWDQIPGNSSHNARIVAVLPSDPGNAAPSGTRANFLAAIGGGPNNPLVPGPCVINGSNSTGPIADSTGKTAPNVAQFDPGGTPAVDDIFPYSIGDYIAQGTNEGSYNGKAIGGHATAVFGRGVLVLHDSDGTAPTATDNTAPYSKATVISPAFTDVLRSVLYDVVRNGGTATAPAYPTSPAYETSLAKIFSHTGFVCTAAKANEDIVSYGFLLEGRNCGALSAGS